MVKQMVIMVNGKNQEIKKGETLITYHKKIKINLFALVS